MENSDHEFLIRFRHSGYAAPLQDLLERKLAKARETNESEPATDANQARVQAVKALLADIFGDE